MLVFDIGFYDGTDTDYYLRRGHKVIAFEANPALFEAGQHRYREAIASKQLTLLNLGVGKDDGEQIDFFIHTDNIEWSTFHKEAAQNWGKGKSRAIKVKCITPSDLFAQFGYPDYLKSDIEGYDIYIAAHLKHLEKKPEWVSFEASDRTLLRHLMLAGYSSFKLIEQSKVPLQEVRDGNEVFRFKGGTGPFGEDTEGEWFNFENAMYMYFRFIHDPFSPSTAPGHWFDVHAGLRQPSEANRQLAYMIDLIENKHGAYCGMQSGPHKPNCPATKSALAVPLFQGIGKWLFRG